MNDTKQEAVLALKDGDPARALEVLGPYEDLLQSRDHEIAYLAGSAYLFQRNDKRAKLFLERCLEIRPDYHLASEKLIHLMGGTGRYDILLSLCKKYPATISHYNSSAYFCALSLMLTGRLDELSLYWEVLKNKANVSSMISEVALILLKLGDQNTASQCVKGVGAATTEPSIAAKAMYFFGEAYADKPTEKLLENLVEYFKSGANRCWVTYQLSRCCVISNQVAHLKDETPTHAIENGAFKYQAVPTTGSRLVDQLPAIAFKRPIIDTEKLQAGVSQFRDIVSGMKADGKFDIQLENIKSVRDHYASGLADPIFVLSTGRCGTTALYELLKDVEGSFSYHSYQWQIKHGDRNHLLYRILDNNFEGPFIEKLVIEFVKARTAEIIYAYVNGGVPILTGHWDTILTPIWAELFPNSKFLYMHRDAKAVFKSIVSKNQWNNAQLQCLKYDPNYPEGEFQFAFDERLTLTQEVCWYLNITKQFALAFGGGLGEDRFFDVSANRLFEGDSETYNALISFLDIGNLSVESLSAHYERPINAKTMREVVDGDELAIEVDKVDKIIDVLERTGQFD